MSGGWLVLLLLSVLVIWITRGEQQTKGFGGCNFLKEAGLKCTGCHEVRICLPANIAYFKTCGRLLPYCRNGFCSKTMGTMCTDGMTTNTEQTTNPATELRSDATTEPDSEPTETSDNSETTDSSVTTESSETAETACTVEADTEESKPAHV